jgi:hypothetical protein
MLTEMRCGELPEFSILDETDGLADHCKTCYGVSVGKST